MGSVMNDKSIIYLYEDGDYFPFPLSTIRLELDQRGYKIVPKTAKIQQLEDKVARLQKISFDCYKAWENLSKLGCPNDSQWLTFADAIYNATKVLTGSDLEKED